ncbi:radical SAM protein [Magnetospirillum sp. UT-4]|uniref:B12-binding domain-containing radical SAM protein n=1 Tax=Magnetospirillum sp. UT-4 TaxID=2681467 RepID=UPI001572D7F3|nr:cobalamin-dependent protein [Magnetospirillum sp. UT-4]
MARTISFADLTHTGQVVSANTFPLGAAMVAAYARQELGDAVEIGIFRYPADFSRWLETEKPVVAGFSIFAWNMALSHEYARRLKDRLGTVTVFGGVNIPGDPDEMKDFLARYPAIDFCVEGEGELAFVEIYRTLERFDFDAEALKRARVALPNTRYLVDGDLIAGPMLPRIADLSIIPSTFADGFSDKFFDDHLIPLVQTTRGCPYSCTFCHEGGRYFNKTRRFPWERIQYELDYIADRVKVPDFIITDLNFGMFEEDIATAEYVAGLQDRIGWPKFVTIATAKNHKDRVLDISRILRGALPPGAAVQSTDPAVLETIKRKNLPLDAVREVARTAETDGAVSFSEVILCLPGDSKAAHFRSVFDVIDKGFTLVRTYQFLMLNGTEAASRASRQQHQLKTRFRVKPMNFGKYMLWDEELAVAEIEEICVSTAHMEYDDYMDCRDLSLTIEIFNNNGLFFELFQFIDRMGVSRADFIRALYEYATQGQGVIPDLYRAYRVEEARNLWDSGEGLAAFLAQPGVIDRYLSGEYGTNEIYKYRALAMFENMPALHDVAFGAARSLLEAHGVWNAEVEAYLAQLKTFSQTRKQSLMDTGYQARDVYTFDFVALARGNFVQDPFACRFDAPTEIEVFHSPSQRELIEGYLRQFGTSLIGLGRILNRAHVAQMYRSARIAGTDIVASPNVHSSVK